MKELILLRHAKSDWGDPELRDFDRPLNQRGEKNAPTMGERLRLRGVQPERIVSSPAKRAVETGRLVIRKLILLEARLVFDERIYEAATSELFRVIGDFDSTCRQVMLLGHNPGLTELAHQLCGLGIDNLPTCGAVGIRLNVENWKDLIPGCGELWFYDYPKNQEPVES